MLHFRLGVGDNKPVQYKLFPLGLEHDIPVSRPTPNPPVFDHLKVSQVKVTHICASVSGKLDNDPKIGGEASAATDPAPLYL